MNNNKKWVGVTDAGKIIYYASSITEADKLSVTHQVKHTIKINPNYKSENKNEK